MPEKYEREIEEILRKMSYPAPGKRRRSSRWNVNWSATWQGYTKNVSPTQLLVLGIGLAFFGYIVRVFIPELSFPVSLLALACLVAGLALSIGRRNGQRPTGWRGRQLDVSANDWWVSLKQRWNDWRRRRGWNGPRWH
ncbi:MAG TPA: hypothetical protein VMW65_03990 [Chloroflexota bacterium]|nr:hypothetical protein [Chloroflexota bacterium]